jgi:uncharacterized protein
VSNGGDPRPRRPRPAVSEHTRFFWEGVEARELRIQRCSACRTLIHPPRPHCGSCGSFDLDYQVVSGRGQVYSHVTVHKPLRPPFTEPYAVVMVQLEEGPRMVSQPAGMAPADVRIGRAVQVEFVEVEEGLTLPLFRPAGSEE